MSEARVVRTWSLVAALAVLHFFLHVGLGIGREAPDLLTLALLVAARELAIGGAAAVGFLFGLLEDALSVLAFGSHAVAMTATGILGALTRDLFVGDSRLFAVSYFFVGKWMRDLVHWIVLGDELRQPFATQVLAQGSLAAAYAAAVGLVVVVIAGRPGEP